MYPMTKQEIDKVKPDELVPADRWATIIDLPTGQLLDLGKIFSGCRFDQLCSVNTSLRDAIAEPRALGAVRLVPETDDEGNLLIRWRIRSEDE